MTVAYSCSRLRQCSRGSITLPCVSSWRQLRLLSCTSPTVLSARAVRDGKRKTIIITIGINQQLDSLMTLKEAVGNTEHSMQLLSDKYDEVLEKVKEQDREMRERKKRVVAMETQDNETDKLKDAVNELEWRNRRFNLEVHGIPLSQNEDLMKKVNDVATRLSVAQLSAADVAALHRLQQSLISLQGSSFISLGKQEGTNGWAGKII